MADLRDQGWDSSDALFDVSLDVKYKGQLHVIEVPLYEDVREGAPLEVDLDAIYDDFERLYAKKYGEGTGFREAGYAIDAIRLRARVPIPNPVAHVNGHRAGVAGKKAEREVYWPHLRERRTVAIYDGPSTSEATGPAILEFPFTSIVLHEGDQLQMTEFGDAQITIEA